MANKKVYAVFETYNDLWPHEDSRYYDRILTDHVYDTYKKAFGRCIELADRLKGSDKPNYTYRVVEMEVKE